MHAYMQHVTDQQIANHRGQVQLHGLEIGPVFRQGQNPQGLPEMEMEHKMMMTWTM